VKEYKVIFSSSAIMRKVWGEHCG